MYIYIICIYIYFPFMNFQHPYRTDSPLRSPKVPTHLGARQRPSPLRHPRWMPPALREPRGYGGLRNAGPAGLRGAGDDEGRGRGRGHFGGLRMIGVLKDILNGWSVWNMIAGWWFGCHSWKMFPFILGCIHHPKIDEVIFFRGVALAHQPVIDMSWMESHNFCAWKA